MTTALQDISIITDDTETLCSETLIAPPTPKFYKHSVNCATPFLKDATLKDLVTVNQQIGNINNGNSKKINNHESNPQQFGFENIVFEIDNRCDDQKIREPSSRYCSLAQFVDGSDIIRQSFKVK